MIGSILLAGNFWDALSNTKKSVAVLFSTLIVGFSIGITISQQLQLPQIVRGNMQAIEVLTDQVGAIENHIERDGAIIDWIVQNHEWLNCAVMAHDSDRNLIDVCGRRPTFPAILSGAR